jgi:putative endonuclease
MFTVYALYSPSFNKLYIGYTANLENRLRSHNEMATKGYTIRYRPWTLVHQEKFVTKKDALARERALRSANGRAFLWDLIKSKNVDHARGSGG